VGKTEKKARLWRRLCNQVHRLDLDLQSYFTDEPPGSQNSAGTTSRPRMQTPYAYFYYKWLLESNAGWPTTRRTKISTIKRFGITRRLSPLLFGDGNHAYKMTPVLEKGGQGAAKPPTITTNASTTSGIPQSALTLVKMSGSAGANAAGLNFHRFSMMPRPEQSGAPRFDGTDITEFLRRWNIECEDVGYSDRQKCDRVPFYCTPDVKEVVELLDGYLERDWTKLEKDLKEQYWQNDTQKNTPTALNQLIRDAPTLDLSVYVLRYTAITQALVQSKEMSTMQRCRRLLDGLSEQLRDKAFDFCTMNDWKLSSHDIGSKDPDFAELKKFVLGKALSAKKKVVYNKERAIEGYEELKEAAASVIKTPPAPNSSPAPSTSPIPTPKSDPKMDELTKLLASLTLMLQANMNPPKQEPAVSKPPRTYDPRCAFCDSTNHRKGDCPELKDAMKKGLVSINANNRIVNAKNGEEIPTMFGKGGMKQFFQSPNSTQAIAVTNITLEEPVDDSLRSEGKVHFTTIDFINDTRSDEIIDANVLEKRIQTDILHRRTRSCSDDEHIVLPAPCKSSTLPTTMPTAVPAKKSHEHVNGREERCIGTNPLKV
jgi:hypothetical protein